MRLEDNEYIKDNKKSLKIIIKILTIFSVISSAFAIYEIALLSSIENIIRYIVMGCIGIMTLMILVHSRYVCKKIKNHRNKKKRRLFISTMVFYSLICTLVGLVILYLYGTISNMNKEYVTYTSDLIVMSDNKAEDIEDIVDYKIGMLETKTSPDGYIIPNEIIKEYNLKDENKIKKYPDYNTMIVDLYDGSIDALLIPDNYPSMFKNIDKFENIDNDTKIIVSKSKKMLKSEVSKQEKASAGKSIKEPFTLLLMGIDSTGEDLEKNAIANGDTMIVITFNPKTLNATILSIPRDSYVPIACWPGKAKNKITHTASYGNDCIINTIEEFLEIDIDYYAKINFKGLVKLVDALGGVDINVEQELCTDNSDRSGDICVHPGYQTLDGEHALVYARNRKQLVNGDFGRNAHQQELIIAMVNKMRSIKNVKTFMNILNTVSNSIDTNLTTKQMLSFYDIAKDLMKNANENAQIINIDQLYLEGSSKMIYDKSVRMKLYNYIPNEYSRQDIVKAMKNNLKVGNYNHIKEFSFSINKLFEKEIVGKGPYKYYEDTNVYPEEPDDEDIDKEDVEDDEDDEDNGDTVVDTTERADKSETNPTPSTEPTTEPSTDSTPTDNPTPPNPATDPITQ